MIYQHRDIPNGTKVWACAYALNKYNSGLYLKCEPTYGVIEEQENSHKQYFFPLKKNGEAKKQGTELWARDFTDTYEECVELYNKKVQDVSDTLIKEIEQKNKLLDKANCSFIKKVKENLGNENDTQKEVL